MTFDEYQKQSVATVHTNHGQLMTRTVFAMGISGEAGEVLEKWKKIVIYKDGSFTPDDVAEIGKEIGDVLWYLATFADSLGLKLDDIAGSNIAKVVSRKARGTILGKGDNR